VAAAFSADFDAVIFSYESKAGASVKGAIESSFWLLTAAFTLLRYQATGTNPNRTFTTTVGKQMGVTSYSYKVGSLDYPQRPVDCGEGTGSYTGGGGDVTPAYCQLAKCFSRLGSTGDHSALSRVSFCQTNI
jgi:hypothetical protein